MRQSDQKRLSIKKRWGPTYQEIGIWCGWKKDLKDAEVEEMDIAEIVFSAIKRVFGEDLLSKKFSAQKIEAGLKIMLYNKYMAL